MNEGVVCPLAFFTLVGTGALPGEMTRFEAVETKVIRPQRGDHLVAWHGFEGGTQV